MRYPITPQPHKGSSPSIWIVLLILLLVFLGVISSCRITNKPSKAQIERAKKTVSDIRTSLYTPADSQLLAEKLYHGSNPELYPGCVSGHIYLAYHSPRPFVKILAEYRIALTKEGWEPSPGVSHNDQNFDYFQLGTQSILSIDYFPIREDLLIVPTPRDPNEQKGTIYYISLLYYEPSIKECSEM